MAERFEQTVKSIVALLCDMCVWIDDIPLDTGPQRFGNKAYRVWHTRMQDVRIYHHRRCRRRN